MVHEASILLTKSAHTSSQKDPPQRGMGQGREEAALRGRREPDGLDQREPRH